MSARPPRAAAWAGLAVAAVTAAAFAPVLANGFVDWDDKRFLLGDALYRQPGWAGLRWLLTTTYNGIYQPLPWLSYRLDAALWGLDPRGFHLTSLLLHSLNAGLVFLLLLRLAAPARDRARPAALAGAGLAALAWALHPLRVEPVAWAAQRRDLLCGLFCLVSVLAHLRAVEQEAPAAPRWRAGSLAAFGLALASKGTAAVVPAVLLVLDVFPLGRLPADPRRWGSPGARASLEEKLSYFLLAGAFAALAVLAHDASTGFVSLADFGLRARLGQAVWGPAFYLWKTILPIGLSPLYELSPLLDPLPFAAAFAFAAAVTGLAWASRRRAPWLAAAWAAYWIILLPHAGFLKYGRHVAADRYSYLAVLPWAALLAAGAARFFASEVPRAAKSAAVVLAALWLARLAGASAAQARVWKDAESLWRRAVEMDARSYFARGNLAGALREQGRLGEAAEEAENSRRARAEVFLRAGRLLAARGDADRASLYLLKALESDPRSAEASRLLEGLRAGAAPR